MKARLQRLWKYRFLLSNLIGRDIKVRYRRSKLGILWSVLNPLLMMLVMTAVFSRFFRMNIPNYPVYLLTGQILFTFFNDASTTAMGSVIASAPLIKKVYVPKYIFPIEKCCFAFVNLIFSMIALMFIMVITGAPFHLTIFAAVVPLFFLFLFSVGVGLFLSAAAIFFRDVMHFWTVIITALTYATPIFYPVTIWDGTFMRYAGRLNPMYWYITAFRNCVMDGVLPSGGKIFACVFFRAVSLLVGSALFLKTQDKFILYI